MESFGVIRKRSASLILITCSLIIHDYSFFDSNSWNPSRNDVQLSPRPSDMRVKVSPSSTPSSVKLGNPSRGDDKLSPRPVAMRVKSSPSPKPSSIKLVGKKRSFYEMEKRIPLAYRASAESLSFLRRISALRLHLSHLPLDVEMIIESYIDKPPYVAHYNAVITELKKFGSFQSTGWISSKWSVLYPCLFGKGTRKNELLYTNPPPIFLFLSTIPCIHILLLL
jgi:hypothetical protein